MLFFPLITGWGLLPGDHGLPNPLKPAPRLSRKRHYRFERWKAASGNLQPLADSSCAWALQLWKIHGNGRRQLRDSYHHSDSFINSCGFKLLGVKHKITNIDLVCRNLGGCIDLGVWITQSWESGISPLAQHRACRWGQCIQESLMSIWNLCSKPQSFPVA